MKKLRLKNVNRIFGIILAVATIILLYGAFGDGTRNAFILIGVVIAILSLVFRMTFYRCPHCGMYLGRLSGDYCQYCGKKLDE